MSMDHADLGSGRGNARIGRIRLRIALGLVGVAALALSGCSSTSSGSRGDGGTGDVGGGGTTSQAQLAAAHAAVATALQTADKLPITTPLKSKPAPGKTLAYLRCDATSCTDFNDALNIATAAVGWKLKTLTFKNSDPSTLISAMQDALRFSPTAVVLPGVDPKLWSTVVPAYEKAKVPLITLTITGLPKLSSPLVPIGGDTYIAKQGEVLANWFIDDSKGKGNALLMNLPLFPLFNSMKAAFENTVKKGCGGCRLKHLDITYPQLLNQQINPAVISELRKTRSINYVIALSGTWVEGLAGQLQASGLTNQITIGAALARQDNMADLLAGKAKVFTSQAEYVQAWMALDAALRLAEGSPVSLDLYEQGPAIQVLTKENVGAPSASWDSPKDYAQQFKQLWHVG